MTRSPMLWGAGLACALGGAVAGTALGSTPILERSTIGAFYQSHEPAASRALQDRATPDHYPLVTREGTVPVAELSDRGLFAQKRYRSVYAMADYGPGEFVAASYDPDVEAARFGSRDPALAIGDAPRATAPAAEQSAPPLALDDGPASVGGDGQAKMIDVQATLAMR